MELERVEQIIQRYGELIVKEMKDELEANDNVATGDLLSSINYQYRMEAERIVVQFLSLDYGRWVDEGRNSGKYPPISKIQEWCSVKGLPEEAAFPIAKSIFTFGIKPKPFLINSIEKHKQNLVTELMQAYGDSIAIELKREFSSIPTQIIVKED